MYFLEEEEKCCTPCYRLPPFHSSHSLPAALDPFTPFRQVWATHTVCVNVRNLQNFPPSAWMSAIFSALHLQTWTSVDVDLTGSRSQPPADTAGPTVFVWPSGCVFLVQMAMCSWESGVTAPAICKHRCCQLQSGQSFMGPSFTMWVALSVVRSKAALPNWA